MFGNIDKKSMITFICCFMATIFLNPELGFAHRINVFCWVEGNKVMGESQFSGGTPVKHGEIKVLARQTKEELLTGGTDNQGKFSFPIPQKAKKNGWDLKVICIAEMGHKNFWIVRANEFMPESSMEQESVQPTEEPSVAMTEATGNKKYSISPQQLEDIVSRVVSKEIATLKKELSLLKQAPITLSDVIGGLGYILGITGIFFYFKGKRKKAE